VNTSFKQPDIENGTIERQENDGYGFPRMTTSRKASFQSQKTDVTIIPSEENAAKDHRGGAPGEASMGLEDDRSGQMALVGQPDILSTLKAVEKGH
jgi:hypothetical protein